MQLALRFGANTDEPRTRDRQIARNMESTAAPIAGRRRKILALCLGGIGDTVLAFAALRELRRAYPDDHLTALTMWPQAADLISDLGIFDEVLQHNFQKSPRFKSLRFAWKLRQSKYDASLLSFPTNRFEYNVLSYILGSPVRWGHDYLRGRNLSNLRFLLTNRIAQETGHHTVDENRSLVKAMTGAESSLPPDIRLGALGSQFHREAERMLGFLKRPLLGVHAGCTTYKGHAARRWPADRFGELCQAVIDQLDMQPVIFGMPDEIDLKLSIQKKCPQVFLAHGESIRLTAAMMARCTAFVSNDSGLAHIASALDVPVVMICGPTASWSIRPYTSTGRVVDSELPCAPCFLVSRRPLKCTHPINQACLKSIGVKRVLSEIADAVRPLGRRPRSDRISEAMAFDESRRISLPVL